MQPDARRLPFRGRGFRQQAETDDALSGNLAFVALIVVVERVVPAGAEGTELEAMLYFPALLNPVVYRKETGLCRGDPVEDNLHGGAEEDFGGFVRIADIGRPTHQRLLRNLHYGGYENGGVVAAFVEGGRRIGKLHQDAGGLLECLYGGRIDNQIVLLAGHAEEALRAVTEKRGESRLQVF